MGDLIFGIGGETFNGKTNYKEMILRYNRGTHGRVHREDDYEQICKKAIKEGRYILIGTITVLCHLDFRISYKMS